MTTATAPDTSREAATILREWARDLSTRTAEEIRVKWVDKDLRRAINKLDPPGFHARLKDFNPIYYLAERVFFPEVLEDPAFLYAPFHRDIIAKQVLEYSLSPPRENAGLLLFAQRESFKSTFMQGVVPLWFTLRWRHLFGKNARVALIHLSAAQAEGNAVYLKQRTINSPWFAEAWPEFHSDVDFGTQEAFNWPCVPKGFFHEPSVMAKGLGADLTGFHFDFISFSDMVNEKHRHSQPMREETRRAFAGMGFTKCLTGSWVFIDGTLYHHADQNNRLLHAKNTDATSPAFGKPLYKSLVLGAGGRRAGKPLTLPYRHSEEVLEQRRAEVIAEEGHDDFWWLQMQNEIHSARMKAADLAWLQTCRQSDISADPQGSWGVITIDPAWKGTHNSGKGDHAAISAWKLERRGSLVLHYLLDGVYSNELTETEGLNEIFRLMDRHGIANVAPEERGGFGFSDRLTKEAITRGKWINVIRHKTMQAKKADRISRLLGKCQGRTVFITEECNDEFKQAFLKQYEIFPQCIDVEDDAIDCAAYVCDPAIQDSYAPMMNQVVMPVWARRAYQVAPFTRYCGS